MKRRVWLSTRYRRGMVMVHALAAVLVAGCGGADDAKPAAVGSVTNLFLPEIRRFVFIKTKIKPPQFVPIV